jgi:hypothetical protein
MAFTPLDWDFVFDWVNQERAYTCLPEEDLAGMKWSRHHVPSISECGCAISSSSAIYDPGMFWVRPRVGKCSADALVLFIGRKGL